MEPCSRSLKCKIHTVALKRAVKGRSKDYDSLFQDYSKKKENSEMVQMLPSSATDDVSSLLYAIKHYQPTPLGFMYQPMQSHRLKCALKEALRK
jgi:hypothetical protein